MIYETWRLAPQICRGDFPDFRPFSQDSASGPYYDECSMSPPVQAAITTHGCTCQTRWSHNGQDNENCVVTSDRGTDPWCKVQSGHLCPGAVRGADDEDYWERGPFFTGIGCVLAIPVFNMRLYSPTSTSKDIEVSMKFAAKSGMIITYTTYFIFLFTLCFCCC